MELGIFEIYLIIINVIGFVLYCINFLLYKFTVHGQVDTFLTITSFVGGSLGIILAILLFDRDNVKDNMMSRVAVICIFVIQLVLFIMIKGGFGKNFTLAIWELFDKYKILLIYLGIINFATFTVFALDKMKALSNQWRYKIVTLLGMCFVGGSLGGLLAMYIFRHKTNQDYFTTGVPLIILSQVIVIIFLTNIL